MIMAYLGEIADNIAGNALMQGTRQSNCRKQTWEDVLLLNVVVDRKIDPPTNVTKEACCSDWANVQRHLRD